MWQRYIIYNGNFLHVSIEIRIGNKLSGVCDCTFQLWKCDSHHYRDRCPDQRSCQRCTLPYNRADIHTFGRRFCKFPTFRSFMNK